MFKELQALKDEIESQKMEVERVKADNRKVRGESESLKRQLIDANQMNVSLEVEAKESSTLSATCTGLRSQGSLVYSPITAAHLLPTYYFYYACHQFNIFVISAANLLFSSVCKLSSIAVIYFATLSAA